MCSARAVVMFPTDVKLPEAVPAAHWEVVAPADCVPGLVLLLPAGLVLSVELDPLGELVEPLSPQP